MVEKDALTRKSLIFAKKYSSQANKEREDTNQLY